MQFAIMLWTSPHAKPSSIYGVLDRERPGQLPLPSPDGGHWSDYRTVSEAQFKLAEAAKQSIAAVGYYLVGSVDDDLPAIIE